MPSGTLRIGVLAGEASGDILGSRVLAELKNHYDELRLIIEAGLDTALVEIMEKIASKMSKLAHDIQHSAEFFD